MKDSQISSPSNLHSSSSGPEDSKTADSPSIAFLGLGAMGSRMARRLVESGHDVALFNRTPMSRAPWGQPLTKDGGVRLAASPASAVEGAQVVISMVRDDEASRAIWLDERSGAATTLPPGALAVEMSTVSPSWSSELSRRLEFGGARFVEAPVVGSLPQAETGQLLIIAAGREHAVDDARPVLEKVGSRVLEVGSPPAASSLKLAVNALFAGQLALLGEVLRGLHGLGVERERSLALLGETPVLSAAAAANGRLMIDGSEPLFPIDLVVKDLGYAYSMVDAVGVEAGSIEEADGSSEGRQQGSVLRAVYDVFEEARLAGLGGENITAIGG